jgi:hypothetical protein
MTISASIPLIVAIVGGIIHVVDKPARFVLLGRIAFGAGLLALLLHR